MSEACAISKRIFGTPGRGAGGIPRFGGMRAFLPAMVMLAMAGGTAEAASEFVMTNGTDLGPVRTALVTVHVIGLILGMGAALFLDLTMLRHLYRDPVESVTVRLLEFGGKLVTTGFVLLCLSGLGFVLLYWAVAPAKLENPKIWAKVMVVSLLMLNGMMIHDSLMPRIAQAIGRPLLAHVSFRDALPFLAAGAISATGWGISFILGMVREFNFAFHGHVFLAVFLLLLALVLGMACLFHAQLGLGEIFRSAPDRTDETRVRWVLARQRVSRNVADPADRHRR